MQNIHILILKFELHFSSFFSRAIFGPKKLREFICFCFAEKTLKIKPVDFFSRNF